MTDPQLDLAGSIRPAVPAGLDSWLDDDDEPINPDSATVDLPHRNGQPEPEPSIADLLDDDPITAEPDEDEIVAAGQLNFVDEIEQTRPNDEARALVHEWIGLPMFAEEDQTPRVVVSFDSEADRLAFLDAIAVRTIHKKTRGTLSIKWPDRPREDLASLRFVDEDDEPI